MARQPYPLALPEAKGKDTIRIFVFGESAAFGDPQPDFGLPRMLEALLSGRYPNRKFEVVNAAMTGINSHSILRAARDCAPHQGDVWVVYMGNNEVVGPFGAGTIFGPKSPPLPIIRAGLALKSTRTGQLIESMAHRLSKPPPQQREWGGMGMFLNNQVRADSPEMTRVYTNFRRNLEDVIHAGRQGGAKVIVGTVASNLKDCAPFASLHAKDLAATDLERWNTLYGQALDAYKNGRFDAAILLLGQAARIDTSFADLHYLWGRCCLELGRDSLAREQLTVARDLDALRFRADSRINQIIRQTASDKRVEGASFVDTANLLAQQSPHGTTGKELLYEHVHLNFRGNYSLARAFADRVAELLPALGGTPASKPAWPSPEDCAKRLGWNDWSRRKGDLAMLARMSEAPFTAQLDHAEMLAPLRQELEGLRSVATPAGWQEAARRTREALALAPLDWVLSKELAEIHLESGDFSSAAESLRHILSQLPHYTEGWQELGRSFVELKQNTEAAAAFHKALELDPDSIYALTGLAQSLRAMGRTDEAMAAFEQALKIKPYWNPAHVELGKMLQAAGRSEEADRHFKQALESRLLTPAALRGLASLCFERGWLQEACTNFADALRLDPSDVPTHMNLGITLSSMGRSVEAQAQFAEALRLDPKFAEAHFRLGLELGRQGQDAEALKHFEQAADLNPELVEARLNLGIALVNQGRGEDALRQFQNILRDNPTNAVALRYVQQLSALPAQGKAP